jgi:hypothetical protein
MQLHIVTCFFGKPAQMLLHVQLKSENYEVHAAQMQSESF